MKRIHLFLSVLFIVSALASCHKGTFVQPNKGKDLTLSATQLQQASADNTFSLNLFKTVWAGNSNSTNLFMSPLSVSIALGMTANGAKGGTLTAMQNTLGFKNFTGDQVNSYYKALLTQLPELDPNTTLKLANSIWYGKLYTCCRNFCKLKTAVIWRKCNHWILPILHLSKPLMNGRVMKQPGRSLP